MSPSNRQPPRERSDAADRWAAFTDRELGALLGALEAADRESSIDDIGKGLWAQADAEIHLRFGE